MAFTVDASGSLHMGFASFFASLSAAILLCSFLTISAMYSSESTGMTWLDLDAAGGIAPPSGGDGGGVGELAPSSGSTISVDASAGAPPTSRVAALTVFASSSSSCCFCEALPSALDEPAHGMGCALVRGAGRGRGALLLGRNTARLGSGRAPISNNVQRAGDLHDTPQMPKKAVTTRISCERAGMSPYPTVVMVTIVK